ncbi:MAG: hypothetical protein ACOCRO_06340 [Halanaerobiales bacterium]
MDELAAEFNRLKGIIEDVETGMNKEIGNLITSVNGKYSESYVRNVIDEMQDDLI